MRYKVETIVTTVASSVYLELEENEISMSHDGSTYKSTDIIEVNDDELDVFMRINGLNGTSWKIEITVTKESDSSYKKELKKSGNIISNQTVRVTDEVKLS